MQGGSQYTRTKAHPKAASTRAGLLGFALALAAAAMTSVGYAGEPIEIELNKLEPAEDACRPYLVFRNRGDTALDTLTLELVLFDGDGFIERYFSVDAGPLPAGKTSVKLFQIPGLDCAGIGRVLLNQVTACAGAEGPLTDCMARIQVSSRLPVDFFK